MDPQQKQAACDYAAMARAKGVDLEEELATGFAARLIRRKARQLVGRAGYTRSDRSEVEQDLRIFLLSRLSKFDPEVSHWNAFVTMALERHVATILEKRRRQKRESSQNITSLSTQVPDECGQKVDLARMLGVEHREPLTGRYTVEDSGRVEAVVDVQELMSRLPEELRDLCERLKTDSIAKISRDLGVPRSTINDRIYRLRAVFTEAGF
jgi:RNA polymerase sigma-70 factor (ECF subfamily)